MNEATARAQIIKARTYCRPLEGGGLETWDQVCTRVIMHQQWLWERAQNKKLKPEQQRELAELKQLLVERKVGVAGRTFWLGGTDVSKRREASQFNCLSKETKVITDEGVYPIGELSGYANVLNINGEWERARVNSYGEQRLIPLEFKRGRSKYKEVVWATPEHNWFVNSEVVQSIELNKGDRIKSVRISRKVDETSNDYLKGVQHGLVYGDGSSNGYGGYSIRLYTDAEDLLPYFSEYNHSYPPSCKGAPHVGIPKSKAWCNLKQFPTDYNSNYLIGFIRGWLAADGSVGKGGQVSLCCGFDEMEWLQKYGPIAGFYITRYHHLPNETNYGKRNKESIVASFSRYCMEAEDILAIRKRKRLKIVEDYFEFVGIRRDLGRRLEEVFCFNAPKTHSFTLHNGLVTSNCAGTKVETVHDLVDLIWLLLQGCGVGFMPVVGTLNGFVHRIDDIRIIRSNREDNNGEDANSEVWNPDDKEWTIVFGDSAEGWAKALGKLFAGKFPAKRLTIDLSNIRPAGGRLSQYGWLSSGDEVLAHGLEALCDLLNKRAGQLLSKMDILDICNWFGVIQTGRRGAEIALVPYGDSEWYEFATAKKDYWSKGLNHRAQSNNSLVFNSKPSKHDISDILSIMLDCGGSEPGFINGEAALRRAPYFSTINPCAEILLANKGFCNLVEIDLAKFKNDPQGLYRAVWLIGRANYRQTCVNLDDGILQRAWHENNQFLRLCGIGLCGIARRSDLGPYDYQCIRRYATFSTYSMARELGGPLPKNTTTIKPGGTQPKIMDTTEGRTKPLGRYIFNNVNFNVHDPLIGQLEQSGYRVFSNPNEKDSVLATFPVSWDDIRFDVVDGMHVNLETAISQLENYKMLMENYVDHNVSTTISYDDDELPEVAQWIYDNWNSYVGVSFLKRTDPTKSAQDLGYQYLPQEVVTREAYDDYTKQLSPLDIWGAGEGEQIDVEDCVGGVCPVR